MVESSSPAAQLPSYVPGEDDNLAFLSPAPQAHHYLKYVEKAVMNVLVDGYPKVYIETEYGADNKGSNMLLIRE